MRTSAFLCCLHILILSSVSFLSAELKVDIRYPDLDPAFDALEAELKSHVDDIAAEVDSLSSEFPGKPLLTEGIGSAVGYAAVIPQFQTLPQHSTYSLSLGGYGTFYAHTLDPGKLSDEFSDMNRDTDINAGGAARLLSGFFTFPLKGIHPELTGFASLALGRFSKDEYYMDNVYLQGGVSFLPFGERRRRGSFRWVPLQLQLGAAFARQSLGIKVDLDKVEQTLTVDPDGGGPMGPTAVSLSVEPQADVSVRTNLVTYSFSTATGITILEGFHLYLGAGFQLAYGSTDFRVNAEDNIKVGGYLADFVSDGGSVTVSGEENGSSPSEILGYAFGGLQLDISSLFISIPFFISPNTGVGAGISLGVALR